MHYRRNMSDRTLRALEREFTSSGDETLLKKIDTERRRIGLGYPHMNTRIRVAQESLLDANYHCYMALSGLARGGLLNYVAAEETVMNQVLNERQLIAEIDQLVQLRHMADNEILGSMGGQAMWDDWREFLETQEVEAPEYGELPEGAMEGSSFMPHMQRAGAQERWQIAERFRRGFDAQSYDPLRTLVTLGLLNSDRLMAYYEDAEEVEDIILNIEDVLGNRDAAQEEFYRAQLDVPPTPEYVQIYGEQKWWKHI